MPLLGIRMWVGWLALAGLAGCDCGVHIVAASPHISVKPSSLDFGTVPTGTVIELPLNVTNEGRTALLVSGAVTELTNDITVSSVLVQDCDSSHRYVADTSIIEPGDCARVIVRFVPTAIESITNVIQISSNDQKTPIVDVPVTAVGTATPQIQVCVLDAAGNLDPSQCTNFGTTPPSIPTLSFGAIAPAQTDVRSVVVTDIGTSPLTVTGVTLQSSSTDLSIMSPPTLPATVAVMTSSTVHVALDARGTGAITGSLVIASDAIGHPQVTIPITATEESCTPPTVTVKATVGSTPVPTTGLLQNTTVTFKATTSGSTQGLSYAWTLVSAPTGNTSQISGTGASVTLDCIEPGTYTVGVVVTGTGGCVTQQATSTVTVMSLPPTCGPSTQFIYTVGEAGELFQFFPSTATMTGLGNINCPDPLGTVNTMAVDVNGIAWVEYNDGELFRVDTTTLSCFATSFNPNSVSDSGWGSCFASDAPGSTSQTYFIAEDNQLASINTTTLKATPIASFVGIQTGNEPELTGTPSAELFGFFPGTPWTLAQIDTTTAALISPTPLNVISNAVSFPGNWAFASWGSDFWFFVGDGTSTDIFHYTASTGTTTLAKKVSAVIVGAGVSPCVQMQ